MVAFKDLHSDAGLKSLNDHLATRSYIDGYTPSASDSALLPQISAAVDASKYPHAARWLTHITSFSPTVRSTWSGTANSTASAPSAKGGKPTPAPAPAAEEEDDEDDFMASLSDDEDEDGGAAAQALIAKKNAEREAAKRATKKGPQAKSSLILDVKPEDSDTNMDDLVTQVKAIEMEGLTWGGHELIPVAFGIRKLRIIAVVVDDLVSTDDLQESIEALEGVQSTDIHAFNKL